MASTAVIGQTPPTRSDPEVSIPFVNHGAVQDFRADGRNGVYIRGIGSQWYYARTLGTCQELPWANAIGVQSRGTDTLDRYSTLIVHGERCPLQSLVASDPPPRKVHRHQSS
jgi:hypothetical protein